MHGHATLVLTLCVVAITRPAAAESSEIDRLRAENARLRARVAEMETRIERLEREPPTPLAAALEQAAAASVREAFDPATGVTATSTAASRLVRPDGAVAREWITWRALRPGEHPSIPPDRVDLVIETAASSGTYRSATALRLSVDGAAQDLPVVGYRSEPITAGRTSGKVAERETVVVGVPLDALRLVADGRRVDGTLGALSFRLTPEQLAAVRALRARVGG